MKRICEIKHGGYQALPIPDIKLGDDVQAWLLKQAKAYRLTTLLAHADDGVIWGKVTDDVLVTSHDVFGDSPSPELRAKTLQQARLFGEKAELLLWRATGGWQARLVEDAPDTGEHYDQPQLLWGNRYVNSRAGFTLVEEGRQGLRHAPPVYVPKAEFDDERHPLCLWVRHYLTTDSKTGVVDVGLSRLVKVDYAPHDVEKEVAS